MPTGQLNRSIVPSAFVSPQVRGMPGTVHSRAVLVAGQATYKKTMLLDAVHLSPIGNLVAAVAIREKLEALGWTTPHSEQAQRRLNQRAQEHR